MFSLELSFPLKKLFIINKNKHNSNAYLYLVYQLRGGSRAAATSKMECFVIIVHGFQPKAVTIITKHSILDAAATLDPPLKLLNLYETINLHFKVSDIVLQNALLVFLPTVSNSLITCFWFHF